MAHMRRMRSIGAGTLRAARRLTGVVCCVNPPLVVQSTLLQSLTSCSAGVEETPA